VTACASTILYTCKPTIMRTHAHTYGLRHTHTLSLSVFLALSLTVCVMQCTRLSHAPLPCCLLPGCCAEHLAQGSAALLELAKKVNATSPVEAQPAQPQRSVYLVCLGRKRGPGGVCVCACAHVARAEGLGSAECRACCVQCRGCCVASHRCQAPCVFSSLCPCFHHHALVFKSCAQNHGRTTGRGVCEQQDTSRHMLPGGGTPLLCTPHCTACQQRGIPCHV
jgi:hypothetical protein